MDTSSFINLETLKSLDIPLAASLVFILITALRYVAGTYWTDLWNRLATVLLSVGLVEFGVALNVPLDPSVYVAGLINGAIVALAVIKAGEAVQKKDALAQLNTIMADQKAVQKKPPAS